MRGKIILTEPNGGITHFVECPHRCLVLEKILFVHTLGRPCIAKIEAGDYGYCESCGVEIGIRRLEARPTATLCIDCKTLDEIREKQMGG